MARLGLSVPWVERFSYPLILTSHFRLPEGMLC
jgi:hypothetical protein